MATFTSYSNLNLAWLRTLSGINTDYRRMQRIEIDAFGWAAKEHLQMLGKGLRENSYEPSLATKTYIPKASGLLRPITILRIQDVIVYQAISNILANKAREKLSKLYLNKTFSNILTHQNYPFFFRRWQFGFDRMNSEKKKAFNNGYTWIGELDITSFYDLIDHELLIKLLTILCGNNDELYNVLRNCLSKWTIPPFGLSHGHGVPQGPLPSSFLAECVLYFLDTTLPDIPNIKYFRYVDDIFVMATNEHDLRKMFGYMEIRLRELALSPHLKKPITKLSSIDDVIFSAPSNVQNIPQATKLKKKQADDVRRVFQSCFHNGKLTQEDDLLTSKLNYALFRINKDRRILKKVLSLVDAYPSSTDAVHYHLRKYEQDSAICDYILQHLAKDPLYEYAISNCLQTLNISCSHGNQNMFRKMCIKYTRKIHNPFLRSISVTILGARKLQRSRLLQILASKYNKDTYLSEHLLLALSNVLPNPDLEKLLNVHVRSANPCVSMVAAYLLSKTNLNLTGNTTIINPQATPILLRHRLIRKRIIGDRIGEILKSQYRIKLPAGFSFRNVLTSEQYRHALYQINTAEGNFATNPSLWVTHMDNFNQILLRRAYIRVGISIHWSNIFGSINATALRSYFPSVSASFEDCHNKRLICPIPHAYSKTLGTFARDIKIRERDAVKSKLRAGYQEFVNKI